MQPEPEGSAVPMWLSKLLGDSRPGQRIEVPADAVEAIDVESGGPVSPEPAAPPDEWTLEQIQNVARNLRRYGYELTTFGEVVAGAPVGVVDTPPPTDAPGYVRQLEDAVHLLWAEMPAEQVLLLRDEMPGLVDFLVHLHDRVGHEEAMVRRNVWAGVHRG